ncbi:MAG: uncharacterized protein QOH97_5489 [Actinoplanes sp.]|nr:uncharacterized protein [Actinoplanes sp.]
MRADAQILVLAKTPVPGRVKTRLCPPCTPEQAATIAAAALADTLDVVTATPHLVRTLVMDGDHPAPPGWRRVAQRGDTLADRLACAFLDTQLPHTPTLLIGMDTPQVSAALLSYAAAELRAADAVLGFAEDGGWWALGLREAHHADLLRDIPTSRPDTGALTITALLGRRLRVTALPVLRDVDTAVDAHDVAARCAPDSRFAETVNRVVPKVVTT